ncbi:MAG: hypothetical protein WDW38_010504 [Sanguina aurantia]
MFAKLGTDSKVKQLRRLRDGNKNRVITLTENQFFHDFGGSAARPYDLAVFFTAAQVTTGNPGLKIAELQHEFSLAAMAVSAGPQPDAVFFAEVSFEDCKQIFQVLNIQSLPLVMRFSGRQKLTTSMKASDIPKSDSLTPGTVSAKYPWTAETMLELLATAHSVEHAPVFRPTFLNSPMFWPSITFLLATAVSLAYILFRMGVLSSPIPYAIASLLIFWFSSSGGMYNIIRGVPIWIYDAKGNMQFFLPNNGQRGSQLGGEGYIMGSFYIALSATLSLLTFFVPCLKRPEQRAGLGLAGVVFAGYMVIKIFTLHMEKSGSGIVQYLFTN